MTSAAEEVPGESFQKWNANSGGSEAAPSDTSQPTRATTTIALPRPKGTTPTPATTTPATTRSNDEYEVEDESEAAYDDADDDDSSDDDDDEADDHCSGKQRRPTLRNLQNEDNGDATCKR